MTNAEIIATFRAEIERLQPNAPKPGNMKSVDAKVSMQVHARLNKLLSFLSDLEKSEKPMNQEGLVEEVKRYYSDNFAYISSDQPTLSILTNVARHFAKWGAEHFRDLTKKMGDSSEIPKDLEEAVEKCIDDALFKWSYDDEDGIEQYVYDAFIAGYKYHADNTLLPEDTVLFNKGVEEGKRLMMEEAVEADVNIYRDIVAGKSWAEFVVEMPTNNLGEKVRVIVIPNTDEK